MELDRSAFEDIAARLLETGWAPAMAFALTDRERTLTTQTFGDAAPEALWPVGSIGKAFTAVLALQMVEEGAIDLHRPVVDYLPWWSVQSRFAPITLHHLLRHSSGLIADSDRAPASSWDVLGLADTETGFAPGEHRHYSNIGYRLVGVVLESASGRPYGELLQERVLDRLGLRASSPVMLHETRRRLPGGHVPYYDDRPWRREHGLAPAPWVESAEADGCSCCTADDLAAFARALWTGDSLLSSSSLARMKASLPPHEGDEGYGYGLEIYDDGFGHDGDMLGYVSSMRVDTAAGLGVVAFANGIGGASRLGEAVLAVAKGGEPLDRQHASDERLVDDGSCPPAWAPFLGRYRAHNPWLPTFLIAAAEGGLVVGTNWMNGSERVPLAHIDGNEFRVGEREWSPERLRLDTVIDGLAQRAVYSGTPYYRAFTA